MAPREIDAAVFKIRGSVSGNKEGVYKISNCMFKISSYLVKVSRFTMISQIDMQLTLTRTAKILLE